MAVRRAGALLFSLAVALTSGCRVGATLLISPGPAGLQVNPAIASLGAPSDATRTLSGVVLAPDPGVVASHAAGLVGHNGTSLVANGTGTMVAGAGAAWRVLATTPLVPISGARVDALDLNAHPYAGVTTVSDAQGQFTLILPTTVSFPVLLRATFTDGGVSLSELGAAGPDAAMPLNPASTAVSDKVLALVATGQLAASAVDPVALQQLASVVAPYMSDQDNVKAGLEGSSGAGSTYDAVVAQNPPLAQAVQSLGQSLPAVAGMQPAVSAGGSGASAGNALLTDHISGVVR